MKSITITLFCLLLLITSYATEFEGGENLKEKIHLNFFEVLPGEYDDFDLVHQSGVTMGVTCQKNPFNREERGYFRYRNRVGRDVAHFYFDQEEECEYLIGYLEKVFELISEENALQFTLNKNSFRIERVVLPSIDPYVLELEEMLKGKHDGNQESEDHEHG